MRSFTDVSGKRRMPSLKLNAVLNSMCSIISMIFPLITYPYVTRVLGAEHLGKVNFASSTISYFSLIAVLGITSYAAREGIQYRDDSEKLNQFSSELFTLSLITTGFSMLLFGLTVFIVPQLAGYKVLLLIYSTTIFISPFGMSWLYTLEEDYLYITIKSIMIQCISLLLLFIVVRSSEDYYKYAALNAFSNVGANVFNLIYSKKYIKIKICRKISKSLKHLKSCLVFFSSSIASSIYSNIDTTMLGFFSTNYSIGIYSAAVKIYTMIKTVLAAITSVMGPRLTFYKSHNMEAEFNELVSKLFKIMITILMPVVVGVIIASREIVVVLCGEAFLDSDLPLTILAFAIFFAMFATVVNGCILIPCRLEKIVLRTTIAAALVNITTNLVAIPFFKQNGAAFTTVLAEFVVLLVGWRYAKKLVKVDNLVKIIFSSAVGCIVMFVMSCIISFYIESYVLRLVIKVASCSVGYGICLLVLKNEIAIEYLDVVIDKFRGC